MHPRSRWGGFLGATARSFGTAIVLLATVERALGAYQASEYAYPLRAGLRWEYEVANIGTVIREVGTSATLFPGRTAWSLRSSLSGTLFGVQWLSTDAGLQMHRSDYPLDNASLLLAQPVTYLPATFDLGQSYQASVKAGVAVGGQSGPLTGDFGVNVTVEATERISVAAGAYDTIRVRVQDTEGTLETWWLAREVGLVKLDSNVDGHWELRSTTATVTPAAELRVTSVRRAPGDRLELRFASETGKDYRIEASTDLRVWTEVGQATGQAAETTATAGLARSESGRFFRIRQGGVGGATGDLVSPVPGQVYPGGTRMGGALFGIEFTVPEAWKGGLRVNTPTLLFGSDTLPGLVLGTLGFAWTRENILADEAMTTGFEMDVGQGGTVRFQPAGAMQDLGNNRLRHEFSGFDQAGQGYWLGIEFVVHPDGGFMMFVGATTVAQSAQLRPELIKFADTVKTTRRPTNRAMIEALSGRSYQWAGESSDWYNGNLNGSASLSSWSEKYAFFCSSGTMEINTKSTGYASTTQSGGWSSTYMSLSYDSSTTEYGQFTIVTDPQHGDVMILATLKGYQVTPVRLEANGQLLVGNQRLVPSGFFQCAGR
jgi:hypothetical protein